MRVERVTVLHQGKKSPFIGDFYCKINYYSNRSVSITGYMSSDDIQVSSILFKQQMINFIENDRLYL